MKNLVKQVRYRLVSRLGSMALFVKNLKICIIGTCRCLFVYYSSENKQTRFRCDLYTNDGTCFPAVNKKLVHQLRIPASLWFWALSFHMCLTWYMTQSYQNGLLFYLCNDILATVWTTAATSVISGNMLIHDWNAGRKRQSHGWRRQKGFASYFNIRQIVTFFINVSLDG